jgi:tRNA dimethylallyltransferase
LPWRVLKLALVPGDRGSLHARIAQRFDLMLEQGFLEEARRLRASPGFDPDLPAMRAVGYRQAWAHLEGGVAFATFRDRAVFATRQLAKRQLTWLRSEVDARTIDPDHASFAEIAVDAVGLFLARATPR